MRLLSTLLLCSASVAGLSTPALAQDTAPEAESDSSYTENVIIVQTRRRAEDVQDVPAVIDTVSADQVSKLNMRSFQDVSAIVPGLQMESEANGVGGGAKLRGVNFDVNASGNNPTVEFYFNDAPITAGVILQQMYDIGMIEVQRGPQGTLRGRASPSGSITVTAKKPDLYEYGGFADMTANDIGTLNFKGAVNIPVIEGVAAIRAAGVWDENEGDRVRSIYAAKDPFARTKSGRISALVQPTDWLKLEGMYQRLDRKARTYDQVASFSEVNPDAQASPVYISTKDRLSNMESGRDVRQIYDIYNWRAEASAMGQVLIYQGQHYTQKLTGLENEDKGDFFTGQFNRNNYSDISSTSHEIRLQNDARVLGIFDYVIGFFDYKNDTPTELNKPTIIGFPISATQGFTAAVAQTEISRTGNSHEQSFFGNVTAHIGEGTEIAGGLRHIDYNETNGLFINGSPVVQGGQSAKKWIYSASIKHDFSRDFMVYASTGSSWRPGLNVVGDFSAAPSALELSFLNLPAETSKSYEIGFKSTLLGGRAHLNVTAYHQKFKNYPYRIPGQGVYYINYGVDQSTTPVTVYPEVAQFNFVGAVPVEVNGVEGDLSVNVTDNWDIGITAAYSLGKIKNGTVPCNDLNGDGIPDATTSAPSLSDLAAIVGSNNISACQVSQRAGFGSPFSATVTSEYRLPLSASTDAFVRGLLSFNGASRVDPNNAFDDVSSYGLVNLFTGIRDQGGAWTVTLFAKNLLNTQKTLTRSAPLFTSYRDPFIPDPNTGLPSAQTYTSTYTGVTMTPPREFGINVRYAFGSR
ncbi:TonB-dependent receptor [Novosphingobium album (ex Hu et al. 2023)]|uniref:TonB-dependent receptor plug domain-containing protein n=1 Tax=Novosphingobium album (ex Hu et al. 2023) TaxID=2930093 RepID=A0ABT0AX64_9SPHN|nr:TonB-dependent receptor plug domain-containing protein [Novosphingobium album (ex Hu et al. 2023)]MCJ2177377.1 TonB-dependent receptor plug domain-containing protein [Novosphingobium album (ex Hu et al. 2023)]